MKLTDFVELVHAKVSRTPSILTDPNDESFKVSLKRWSDIDLEVPGAISKPINEADIVLITRAALEHSIPFILASGGHSSWSTVDETGFVLDFSNFKDVVVDASQNLVTVKGGHLMKEIQVALYKEGQFAAVGNGSTVGVIPHYLNGGTSIYTPMIGYACENILSAKVIMANGKIVECSEERNLELFWAIRGAGQFFAIVLELGIRTYQLSLIGNPEGSRQIGTYIFSPGQAANVCRAMAKILRNVEHHSAGHLMVMYAPSDFRQVLMVAPQFFGSQEEATRAYRPLLEIGPVHHMLVTSTFETHSDHLDMMCSKEDFKRFSQICLDGFHPENFLKLVDLHSQLLASCPGSERSGYTFEWHSPCERTDNLDVAFGIPHIDFWLNVLSWYTDPAQHDKVAEFDRAAQAQMRVGTEEEDFISYTNCTREDPIEYRYKGSARLAKLRELKKKWDPKGVFTKELL